MRCKTGKNKQNVIKKQLVRILTIITGITLTISSISCGAAEISDSVTASCDEAYYATLDYYGNLNDASIVKSYTLNGATSITDYGLYNDIINLTDSTEPVVENGKITFQFPDSSMDHFYFEGKTSQPFARLPWKLSLSYRLNGVPKKAEELAGQAGEVEINIDMIPNKLAGEYARDNETLEAIAVFNADDILSLDAPGAQIQLLGNLRVVMFVALPGEEEHFTIRVGTNDFSFDGMTFMISPATLSQLSQITKLRDTKEDVEDSYHDISDSLDELLDAINGMNDNLRATANGLDQLNQARQTISAGKGTVYTDLDTALQNLDEISKAMEPADGHLTSAKSTLSTLKNNLTDMNTSLLAIHDDLDDVRDVVADLDYDLETAEDIRDDLDSTMGSLDSNLQTLETALNNVNAVGNSAIGDQVVDISSSVSLTVTQINAILSQMETLYESYEQYIQQPGNESVTFNDYATAVLSAAPYSFPADKITLFLGIWNSKDDINQQLKSAQTVSNGMSVVAADTANVIDNLRDLYTSDIYGLIYDYQYDAELGNDAADELLTDAKKLIAYIDQLHTTLDNYEPELQDMLDDTIALSDSLTEGINNLHTSISDTEALLQESGSQLDAGTKQTLTQLAASLRKSASGLDCTDDIKQSKQTISDLIEDQWDEHTGEENNVLLMDSDATPVSLTSSQNQVPSSIQILIRTEEIKPVENNETTSTQTSAPSTTFWGRVGRMFTDFWHAITRLF